MADGDDDLELDDDLAAGPQDTDDDQGTPNDQSDDQDDGVDAQDQEGDEQVDLQDRRSQDQRQPSRFERRLQGVIESSRQKDQQISDLNRRIDALLQTRSQPQGESREQRDARRATMSPEDRMYDVLSEHTEAWGREKQSLTLGMADQMDKAAFDAKCSVNKTYAKRQEAVEKKLADLRANGQSAPREAVLRWIIGDQALAGIGSKEAQSQRREAGQRVRRQQARPAANGSDVRAERGRQTSRERRLADVQI